MTAKTISFMNFKGGCTKTTSTVGLGAALARKGKKVLIVDCDPQGHAGFNLGIKRGEADGSLEVLFSDRNKSIVEIIHVTSEDNLWIVPAGRGLLRMREQLRDRLKRESLLSKILVPVVQEFDFILLDTPPDEGILSMNAMYASQYVIIPTVLETLSLTGINPLYDSISAMREAYENKKIGILGVLVNRYDARLKTENDSALKDLASFFGDVVFSTRIRSDEEVKKAVTAGQTVFQKCGKAKAATDFMCLADEVLKRVA